MNVGSGLSLIGSFAHYDRATSSWRTCQALLWPTTEAHLATFSETWPRAGMTWNGIAYLRSPLVPRTAETACSLWLTPDVPNGGRIAKGISPTGQTPKGKRQVGLAMQVRMVGKGLWPTPTHADGERGLMYQGEHNQTLLGAVRMWPTPRSYSFHRSHLPGLTTLDILVRGLYRNKSRYWPTPKGSPSGPDYARRTRQGSGGDDLATAVSDQQIGGQLNPMWVEWLMGFPLGWTDCGDSATRSSRRSRNSSRSGSRKRKG